MLVYADTTVCQWNLRQIGIDSTNTLDAPIDGAVFHVPFPYRDAIGSGLAFEQRLDNLLTYTDKIAVLCSELHAPTVDFIARYSQKNIAFFICGFVNGVNTTPWMDWFDTTVARYKNNNLLAQLTPYAVKPKMFDVLLGGPRDHRSFVYNYIQQEKLTDQVVMTYLNDVTTPLQQYNQSGWIWPDGLDIPKDNVRDTVTPTNFQGQWMTLSQIIPVNIYNQTAYTVVAETNAHNHFNFYTEKIVKPILAERLFVVFSGQNYLKNLRSLGFRTFDEIIDETYDTVSDDKIRYTLACKQIQYLINQPQEIILDKIQPIVAHNKKVMMTTDWLGQHFKALGDFLLGHTN
jgi:hypothetical protein